MASGQLTHIGIGKEIDFGVPVAAEDYLKFTSESLMITIEELVSAQIEARRDEPESHEGLGTVAGDTVHEVHPNSLGHILRSWFGAPVTTQPDGIGAPSVYQHEFTPTNNRFSADSVLPPYTLEVHRDLAEAFQYAGCVANVLSWTYGVGAKILGLTASWLGKDEAKIVKTTPVLEVTKPFKWNEGIISIGGSPEGTIETLSFTQENGLIGVPLLDGTKRIAKIEGDAFRFGTIAPTFHITSLSEFDKYKGWLTSAWTVIFTGPEIEGGLNFKLQFDFPKVLYTAFPVNIGGPARITVGASGKLKYDASAGYLVKVTLTNNKTSY